MIAKGPVRVTRNKLRFEAWVLSQALGLSVDLEISNPGDGTRVLALVDGNPVFAGRTLTEAERILLAINQVVRMARRD